MLGAPVPKITITRAGSYLTVTDGKRTRESLCASPGAAKGLASRMKNDQVFAAKWMRYTGAEQLELPLEVPPAASIGNGLGRTTDRDDDRL